VAYTFGRFTVDPRTRQLLRDGEEVHLSLKAFDLLHLLIEDRARPVPREELHKRLWPSTFVLETNLASLVAEIRRALGDSADDPQYVRTMHRVGYWFIGRVTGEGETIQPAANKPAVRFWLVWETARVALSEGENIIGRAPDAAVWIDAAGVSRHHARIVVHDEVLVEDLGSKNGTFVHGRRVTTPQRLTDGDQIRLGSVVVTFRLPPAVDTTDTVSSL
jgi:DNA-binding winged helix-turn-helix (wHTH) protein